MTARRSIDESATDSPWRFSLCAPLAGDGATFGIEPPVMRTTASRCAGNEFASMRPRKRRNATDLRPWRCRLQLMACVPRDIPRTRHLRDQRRRSATVAVIRRAYPFVAAADAGAGAAALS
ncbi:hypothetical protein ACV229_18995 [Burkholderia sp. MR1-5-21]